MTTPRNSNCDKTQKLKLWPNSKTWIVTKQNKIFFLTKLENLICDKTQKLKLWQNSRTEIVTKLKKLN